MPETTYRGKPLSECTKEELIEAVEDCMRFQQSQAQSYIEQLRLADLRYKGT